MCTEPMALVRRTCSEICIHLPYGCTKIQFAPEGSQLCVEVASAFLRAYTYCTRCYGAAQDVYRAYGFGEAYVFEDLYPFVLRVYENTVHA